MARSGVKADPALVGPMAERVGFEPTESRDSTLFKSAAFNRSATSPGRKDIARRVTASGARQPETISGEPSRQDV